MKQETLEEVAKEFFRKFKHTHIPDNYYLALVEFSKLQSERMYSEEEVRKLLQSQRGNCYVAILTKTRDEELASFATLAPEPGGKDGWVKQFKKK